MDEVNVYKFSNLEGSVSYVIATDYEEAVALMKRLAYNDKMKIPVYVSEAKLSMEQIFKRTPAIMWLENI